MTDTDKIAELEAEIRRATSIKDILESSVRPVESVYLKRSLVYEKSLLGDFVTLIKMPTQNVDVFQEGGKAMQLRAHAHEAIDKKILFGTGIDEPLGIINSSVTIKIEKPYSDFCIYDLSNMTASALSLSTARWVVSHEHALRLNRRLAELKSDLPVIVLDALTTDGQGFQVGLFSLQYYVLGEYGNEASDIMVDGQPVLQYPVASEDETSRQFSPFVLA